MSENISKIRIRGQKIGFVGLAEIFENITSMNLSDEAKLKSRLIELVMHNNYIPQNQEEEYARALVIEYKKFCSLEIKEEDNFSSPLIQILGPGCPACDQLERDTKSILAELNVAANVEHIRDVNEIASFGFIRTPALVINRKVILSGRTLPKIQLKKIIAEEINREN